MTDKLKYHKEKVVIQKPYKGEWEEREREAIPNNSLGTWFNYLLLAKFNDNMECYLRMQSQKYSLTWETNNNQKETNKFNLQAVLFSGYSSGFSTFLCSCTSSFGASQ